MELTIKIDNRKKQGKALLNFLEQIAEAEDYLSIEKKKKKKKKSKQKNLKGLSEKELRKQKALDDIRQAMHEVKLAKEGKIKLKTAKELLDEL